MHEQHDFFEQLLDKKEQPLEALAFEFELNGRTFQAEVEPDSLAIHDADKKQVVLSFVVSQEGTAYARINGVLGPGAANLPEFTVTMTNNLTNPESAGYKPDLTPTRGLVAKFVEEVLSQGIIDTWISDAALSENAANMYSKLRENPNLTVMYVPNVNRIKTEARNAYIVFKKSE